METLPSAFTLADAREAGFSKDRIYTLLAAGEIERLGRGVFVKANTLDPSLEPLAAATAIHPLSTMCLASALIRHGLSDDIPTGTDIALPRGTRHPAGFEHVTWRSFDQATFQIGREPLDGAEGLFIYSPERTIIDSFRLAYREGTAAANEALKRWLRRRGNHPSKLLDMARSFPKAYPSLHSALEVLV